MKKLLHRLSSWYLTRSAMPYWIVVMLDCALVMFSGYVGMYFQIGGSEFASHFWEMSLVLLTCLVPELISFRIFNTYRGVIRFSSFIDLLKIVLANLVGFSIAGIAFAVTVHFVGDVIYLPGLVCLFVMLLGTTSGMCLLRICVKSFFDTFRFGASSRKVFIYGAQSGAVAIAKGLKIQTESQYRLAGFIDPDGTFKGSTLMGCKVYQDNEGILETMKSRAVDVLVVSPLQVNRFRSNQRLVSSLTAAGIKILMIPDAEEWDGRSDINHSRLREVEIEDLLPRDQIEIDMKQIAAQLRDKRILITGAAGSIGSEIVRQVASFHPEEMILVDQAETPMHDLRRMMAESYAYIKASTIVASITGEDFMERVFSTHKPDIVFHAAAYKHVPMMEDNPAMAVLNNIRGTRIIADLSVKYGVKKFVMISTDKAVNPTNVMGCSKRICEIYCQSLNSEIRKFKDSGAESLPEDTPLGRLNVRPVTQFITTRFGNVLGSNGSVIPIFREQIKRGGPVTVTDPEIIRYFMLIPEACKLVLEAGALGRGGEILVFDMGQPVRIADLARQMIDLSGAKDVKISYTGLRDGEKLYEEVLSSKENVLPTSNPKIMVAKVREYDWADALANEDRLCALAHNSDAMEIVRMMKTIVPEYKSKNSVYCSLDS